MKKIFLFAFLLPILFITFVHAAEKEIVFKDWALRPSPDTNTWVLEQRVYVKGSNETPLVHMAVQRFNTEINNEKSQALWTVLRVPLGVLLGKGLQLKIDRGKPVKIPFHHCAASGCIGLIPLSSDLKTRLEAGREAVITYRLLNGQNLGVPVSLLGIKSGLAELMKKEK